MPASPSLYLWSTILLFMIHPIKPISESSLLASTLFTFQDYVCEEEMLRIGCPSGTTIAVKWSMYGRQVSSQDMCPAMVDSLWTEDGTYKPVAEEDRHCMANSSLKVLLDKCQDKRKCTVFANPTVFGEDPCPGTSKYLEVAYKCRPNEFRKRMACEGQDLSLHCTKSKRIVIYSAVFGREAGGNMECPAPSGMDRECQAPCALQVVMRECHGRRKCSIPSNEGKFGNPCAPNTPKYLSIVYTCVPKRILREMRRNKDEGFPNTFCADDGGILENDDEEDDEMETRTTTTLIPDWGVRPPYESGPPYDDRRPPYNDRDHPPYETGPSHDDGPGRGGMNNHPPPSTWDYGGRHIENNDQPGGSTDNPCAVGVDGKVPDLCQPSHPVASKEEDGYIGFINDWLGTAKFIEANLEKFILYLMLGLMTGIILLLLLVICRLLQSRRRQQRHAKLEISEPIPNTTHQTEDFSLLDRSNSSNDGIEILSISQNRPPPYRAPPEPSHYRAGGTGTLRNVYQEEDLPGSDAYNNDYRNMSGTLTFRNENRANQNGTGTFRGEHTGTFRHEGSPSTFRNNQTGTFSRDQGGGTGTFKNENGGGTGTFRNESRMGRETTPLMEQTPTTTSNGFHPEHVGGASTLPRHQPMTHDDVIAEIWSQPPPPVGSATVWTDTASRPAPFPSDSNRSLNNNYYG